MSGGHDKSVLGVARGDYDMAAIASDVLDRMVSRGNVKADDFRVLYKSEVFPTNGYVHAHDLKPELAAKIRAVLLQLLASRPSCRRNGTAKTVSCR